MQGHFGGEIGRIAGAIVAAAIAYGLVLGAIADGLVALRLAPPPALAALAAAPVAVGPRGRGRPARRDRALGHGRRSAALRAATWYARGQWRRTVQVPASDVLHPGGIVFLSAIACAASSSPDRDPHGESGPRVCVAAPRVQARSRRIVATLAASLAITLLGTLLLRLPSAPHAHGRPTRRARTSSSSPRTPCARIDSDPRIAPNLRRRSPIAGRGSIVLYVSLPRTFPSSRVTWPSTGRHPHHHGISIDVPAM